MREMKAMKIEQRNEKLKDRKNARNEEISSAKYIVGKILMALNFCEGSHPCTLNPL